jgi:hypothetical protein
MEEKPTLGRVFDAALEIARRRRDTLQRLRAALQSGDEPEALKLAKELCGLHHEKSSRTCPRVN